MNNIIIETTEPFDASEIQLLANFLEYNTSMREKYSTIDQKLVNVDQRVKLNFAEITKKLKAITADLHQDYLSNHKPTYSRDDDFLHKVAEQMALLNDLDSKISA